MSLRQRQCGREEPEGKKNGLFDVLRRSIDLAMIVARMTNCSGTFEGSSRWMGCYRF